MRKMFLIASLLALSVSSATLAQEKSLLMEYEDLLKDIYNDILNIKDKYKELEKFGTDNYKLVLVTYGREEKIPNFYFNIYVSGRYDDKTWLSKPTLQIPVEQLGIQGRTVCITVEIAADNLRLENDIINIVNSNVRSFRKED